MWLRQYETENPCSLARARPDPRRLVPALLPAGLAGETLYEQGADFRPEMLGETPDEMQQRFVKYLRERSPEKLRALQILALAQYFDDELFDYLVTEQYIQGVPRAAMAPMLLANRSYVRRFEANGKASYRFHRHMQQALLDDLAKDAAEKRPPSGRSRPCSSISPRVPPSPQKRHSHQRNILPAYDHGVDILLDAARRGSLPVERVDEWFRRFNTPFDERMVPALRVRAYESALDVCTALLGSDGLLVGEIFNELGLLYSSLARHPRAEVLLRKSLAIREQKLGEEHHSLSRPLNNLALSLLLRSGPLFRGGATSSPKRLNLRQDSRS